MRCTARVWVWRRESREPAGLAGYVLPHRPRARDRSRQAGPGAEVPAFLAGPPARRVDCHGGRTSGGSGRRGGGAGVPATVLDSRAAPGSGATVRAAATTLGGRGVGSTSCAGRKREAGRDVSGGGPCGVGIECHGYKDRRDRTGATAVRQRIVAELEGTLASWLDLQPARQACVESDHVLDALISALVAIAAKIASTHPPTECQRDAARREGWIHLPSSSLSSLRPR